MDYASLVYATQVSSIFRARWLAIARRSLASSIHIEAAEEKKNWLPSKIFND